MSWQLKNCCHKGTLRPNAVDYWVSTADTHSDLHSQLTNNQFNAYHCFGVKGVGTYHYMPSS